MTTTRPGRQRTIGKCHVCAQFAQAKNFIALGIMGQVKRSAAISGGRPSRLPTTSVVSTCPAKPLKLHYTGSYWQNSEINRSRAPPQPQRPAEASINRVPCYHVARLPGLVSQPSFRHFRHAWQTLHHRHPRPNDPVGHGNERWSACDWLWL